MVVLATVAAGDATSDLTTKYGDADRRTLNCLEKEEDTPARRDHATFSHRCNKGPLELSKIDKAMRIAGFVIRSLRVHTWVGKWLEDCLCLSPQNDSLSYYQIT